MCCEKHLSVCLFLHRSYSHITATRTLVSHGITKFLPATWQRRRSRQMENWLHNFLPIYKLCVFHSQSVTSPPPISLIITLKNCRWRLSSIDLVKSFKRDTADCSVQACYPPSAGLLVFIVILHRGQVLFFTCHLSILFLYISEHRC